MCEMGATWIQSKVVDCLKRHKLKKRFESDKIFLPQNNTPKETSYEHYTTL